MPSSLAIAAPIIGGIGQGIGSWFGGNKLADAAQQSAQLQQQMFQQASGAIMPYVGAGQSAWSVLAPLLGIGQNTGQPGFGSLTNPFQPTMQQLEQTPGYQFALSQGQKAVQNAASARGLGSSGAAVKGAANYAKDLASTTYQQQFENYWNQNKNIASMYMNPFQIGAGAAQGLGQTAVGAGKNIGDAITGMGSAQAAMYNSLGSVFNNAIQGGANNYLGYNIYSQLMQPGYGNMPGEWNPNVPGGLVGTSGPTGSMYTGGAAMLPSGMAGNPLSWGQPGYAAPGAYTGWPGAYAMSPNQPKLNPLGG